MSEECGSCEYNRQCFIKKNVGIFECEKEKIRVVRYEDYEKLENIIKEVREYINDNVMVYAFNDKKFPHWDFNDDNINDILEILDKVSDE